MLEIAIIGGGAAGMMSAIFAARSGGHVTIYEKNEKLGKKLYITGKGRCNLTNHCEKSELFEYIVTNRKFLYSSFYGFTNQDVINFFEELGLPVKTERGGRVFPVSDKSSDVISALEKELKRLGVTICFSCEVKGIQIEREQVTGLYLSNGKKISCDRIIIATGGLSYASTGSTGDGYQFAKEAGHTITPLSPCLVPFCCRETWIKELQGLALKNIQIQIQQGKKKIYEEFGELLFTHFGVSGPVILSASSILIPYTKKKEKQKLVLSIDLKPALTEEQLDIRLLRDLEECHNKQFKNSLDALLPKKLIPVLVQLSNIAPEKKVNFITKQERFQFVHLMKNLEIEITALRGYEEAVITHGGVEVKEINPQTMESKLVKYLYFAGEVLDLDALTGGYNLQIAWSTAHAAGCAAAEGESKG